MPRHPPPLRLLLWRLRVPLTALALLACGTVAVAALRPAPEPSVAVVVAARALEPGTELEHRDVRLARWPERLVPHGAPSSTDLVVGRTLAVEVPAGAPLLPGVVADDALWAGAPSGAVAAPVRLADAEFAQMLRAGDRVDVLAVAHEGGPADRLARGALVLRGPVREEEGGRGLFGGGAGGAASGLVVLAVSEREAASIAEHTASSAVVAVLVQ